HACGRWRSGTVGRELRAGPALCVDVAETEEDEAGSAERRERFALDGEPAGRQHRRHHPETRGIRTRLRDPLRAPPHAPLGGPPVHDCIGDRLEPPGLALCPRTRDDRGSHRARTYSGMHLSRSRKNETAFAKNSMTRHVVRSPRALVVLLSLSSAWSAVAWGPQGHALVTRAAVAAVDELPPWFRDAADA